MYSFVDGRLVPLPAFQDEREIGNLQARPFMTTEQQWRVSELKKLKLMAKDRMEALIREHQRSAQTTA